MKIEITGKSIAKSVKRALYRSQMPLTIVAVLGVVVLGFITYRQSREIHALTATDIAIIEYYGEAIDVLYKERLKR